MVKWAHRRVPRSRGRRASHIITVRETALCLRRGKSGEHPCAGNQSGRIGAFRMPRKTKDMRRMMPQLGKLLKSRLRGLNGAVGQQLQIEKTFSIGSAMGKVYLYLRFVGMMPWGWRRKQALGRSQS